MHPELLQIALTADFDQEISTIDAAVTGQKRALAAAKKALQGVLALLEAQEQKIAATRSDEGLLQKEIEKLQRRHRSATRVLEGETTSGDPEAAERQVHQCEELIDARETLVLEILEKRDTLEVERARLLQERSALEESLHAVEQSVPLEISRLTDTRTGVWSQREDAFSKLPPEVQKRYLAVTRRRGTPIARIVDDCCSACYFKVASQHRSDIVRGLIAPCKSCGRWLLVDAESPA
jgi:predicted  nucleic acid-binding Zn-ribbon protein